VVPTLLQLIQRHRDYVNGLVRSYSVLIPILVVGYLGGALALIIALGVETSILDAVNSDAGTVTITNRVN